jgi:hypothetical protein
MASPARRLGAMAHSIGDSDIDRRDMKRKAKEMLCALIAQV